MSSTTDSGDGPEVPAAVLDGLTIYDGQASIHFVGDDEATIDGLLAHSLVEPADELRQLAPAGQALLADHVAAMAEEDR